MKKRYLLPIFAAFMFSLAACDSKENKVTYKDADGKEQTVDVKATDDSTKTAEALYAVGQAASASDKAKDLTKFGMELNLNLDAKLDDTQYAKGNVKVEAAATKEGAYSASLSGDVDVNVSTFGVKGKADANVYYDLSDATNKDQKLYVDYNLAYTMKGVEQEQKMNGKYFITSAELTEMAQSYASMISSMMKQYMPTELPDVENPQALINGLPIREIMSQFDISTQAKAETLVKTYGIKVSAASKSEIVFACDVKLGELIDLFAGEANAVQLAAIKTAYKDVVLPVKLTFNTDFYLPSRVEVDFGSALTASLNLFTTMAGAQAGATTTSNATAKGTFSLAINYNGGTVKKLTNTKDYVDIATVMPQQEEQE